MKKSIFLICLFFVQALFGAIDPSSPSIVFVHIGKQVPPYLETAIKQARLFNSCQIILIANEGALKLSQKSLEVYRTECISCESLSKTAEHIAFLKNSKLDRTFRDGFWSAATERFFYLQDLMRQYGLKSVLHLESDIMLYVDLLTLMPIFKKWYPHIGVTLANDEKCIPGIVYIADWKSMDHLAQFMCQELSQGKNDMESLADYYRKFSPRNMDTLPVIMKSYVTKRAMISANLHFAKRKFDYCKHEDEFRSIFDGAALGQYLGGVDPRNDPNSKPGFVNESTVFDCSLLTYSWKVDEKKRRIPYAKYGGTELRINNLHIHSKKLSLFLSE